MSLYGFKTDHNTPVIKWINATKKRGEDNNLLKNPFVWNIKTKTKPKGILKRGELFVVIDAKPLLPNFSIMGWVCGVFVLMIWGATFWLIPCMVLGCLHVFWTGEFLFLMTKKALRKHGYSGPIKRLKHPEIIRELIL